MLIGARRATVVARVFLNGPFPVDVPQIADRRHLNVMSALVLSDNPIQFLAAAPGPDVGQGNTIVGSKNPGVGSCGRDHRRSDQRGRSGQERPAINFCFRCAHCSSTRAPLIPLDQLGPSRAQTAKFSVLTFGGSVRHLWPMSKAPAEPADGIGDIPHSGGFDGTIAASASV